MDLECLEVKYLSMVQESKEKGSEGFSLLLDHTLQEKKFLILPCPSVRRG